MSFLPTFDEQWAPNLRHRATTFRMALQLLEEMGIVSKMEICAMRGTSYDQVLKNKERERKLEERYGYTPPPRRPRPADTPPQEDLGQ